MNDKTKERREAMTVRRLTVPLRPRWPVVETLFPKPYSLSSLGDSDAVSGLAVDTAIRSAMHTVNGPAMKPIGALEADHDGGQNPV